MQSMQIQPGTMLALRLKTGMTRKKFAKRAGIAIDTQRKLEEKKPVTALGAQRSLNLLNELLGTNYILDDVEGLTISRL